MWHTRMINNFLNHHFFDCNSFYRQRESAHEKFTILFRSHLPKLHCNFFLAPVQNEIRAWLSSKVVNRAKHSRRVKSNIGHAGRIVATEFNGNATRISSSSTWFHKFVINLLKVIDLNQVSSRWWQFLYFFSSISKFTKDEKSHDFAILLGKLLYFSLPTLIISFFCAVAR